MTVAIHQPNYLPWLGYFYKLFAADVFVFHDAVPFSKASYTKRCRIRRDKVSAETIWLSVPVCHFRQGTLISQIAISHDTDWRRQHLRKISNTYRSAPYFDTYAAPLEDLMEQAADMTSIEDYNIHMIHGIAGMLDLRPVYRRSSELPVEGRGTALNMSIVRHIGGDTYLAGAGSLNYEDDSIFTSENIHVLRHDIKSWLDAHPYDQGTGRFTNGLSVVDALMHLGVAGIRDVFQGYQKSVVGNAD